MRLPPDGGTVVFAPLPYGVIQQDLEPELSGLRPLRFKDPGVRVFVFAALAEVPAQRGRIAPDGETVSEARIIVDDDPCLFRQRRDILPRRLRGQEDRGIGRQKQRQLPAVGYVTLPRIQKIDILNPPRLAGKDRPRLRGGGLIEYAETVPPVDSVPPEGVHAVARPEIHLPLRPLGDELEQDLAHERYLHEWVSPFVIISNKTRRPMTLQHISLLARKAMDKEESLSNITFTDLRHDFIIRQLETHDWAYVARIAGMTTTSIQANYGPLVQNLVVC